MIGAGDDVMLDRNVLLRPQLVDQLLGSQRRRDFIGIALNDDARSRAWGEKAEVIHIGRRRYRDETANFGAAHQELHADQRTEAEASDPRGLSFNMKALDPIQRSGCIRKLANAIVKLALAFANSAKIEAQGGESTMYERSVQRLHDGIVHRAAALRMRVENHGNWSAWARRRRETTFKAAVRTGKYDFWHNVLLQPLAGNGRESGLCGHKQSWAYRVFKSLFATKTE